MSLEQLKNFCEFESDFGTENKTHIAQWALAEIERLTALCQEYRENGDRLMRVADEYKAEIELGRRSLSRQSDCIDILEAKIERKDAALRVALDALQTAALNDPAREDDHYYDKAIEQIKAVL